MGYRNRRGSNRDRGYRGRRNVDRGPREMYNSVCSSCGKECEVPFKPTGERPVYCQECWADRRPSGKEDESQGRYAKERSQRSPLGGEELGMQILSELKRIREILDKRQPS